MNKIKVLQIGKYYPPYCGGTESHLFTLVDELKEKAEIKVLVSNTCFKTEIKKLNGVEIYRLKSAGNLFSLPLTFSLPLWLTRLEADILHFHLPNPLAVVSYFISRPKGKVVVSYHSDIVRQRIFAFLFNPLLFMFLKKAEAIIVTSDNLIENSSILRRFKNKCRVIPHGIDISQFEPGKAVLAKAKEIKREFSGPLVLFVGRLVYYKGLEFLLRAMKDVNAKLMIVGAGPLKIKFQKIASRLGLENKVYWMGKVSREDIVPIYHACDLFVLPSSVRAESFGIVQLEAFACSKPVISTNLPTGVTFVNINNKTGLVVEPGSHFALSSAIKTLLSSSQMRETFGKNGRERLEKEFCKEEMAQKVLTLYKDII